MPDRRTLVVGTTGDYVEVINRRFPQRALFITDFRERARAAEPAPPAPAELLTDLSCPERVLEDLRGHLDRWGIVPGGVACFDCESMLLAAGIARALGLPYPSAEAVLACRSKYLSKRLWRQAGLTCPAAELVDSAAEAAAFLRRTGGPAVLKPLTGSGSELIHLCRTEEQCRSAFEAMRSRLASHPDGRMYAPYVADGREVDPRGVLAIEEFIEGEEYSCDFALDGGRVRILRVAEKVSDPAQAFGTTLAYVVPGRLPPSLGGEGFGDQLRIAAEALGLTRAVCMIDLMVRDGQAYMIELAPRPGGDCLPPLLLRSCGMDILGVMLDFAEGRAAAVPPPERWRPLVGLRLFARQAGEVRAIDTSPLEQDSRVVECFLKRAPGHRVVLPPEDYESRLLGHVIFEPPAGRPLREECAELAGKLKLEIRPWTCAPVSPS